MEFVSYKLITSIENKKSMRKIVVFAAVLILTACGTALLMPAQSDVDRVVEKFPGYTLTALNEGKTLYENNCKKCHGLKKPENFTEAQWNKIMPPMAQKAKINAEQEESIRKYVITMSGAQREKN